MITIKEPKRSAGKPHLISSVAYIAPEVLQRTGHGKAVDWYLLGVLLYEMLVGVPPHFAKSPNEIFEKIANSSVMVPTKLSEEAKSLLYNVGSI